jgi:hypothetical protein
MVEAMNGMVKIGRSSNPEFRAESYTRHSASPCRIIAIWPASSAKEESALHREFEEYRHHNEWFIVAGRLREFVEGKRGLGLSEPIPSFDALLWKNCGPSKQTTRAKRSASMKAAWQRALENPRSGNLAWRKSRIAEGRTA